jgi:hypothetical protein
MWNALVVTDSPSKVSGMPIGRPPRSRIRIVSQLYTLMIVWSY